MNDQFYRLTDFIEDLDHQTTEYVNENFQETTAEALGMDRRAGGKLWINEGAIAVYGGTRNLDYYGGFEYVDGGDRQTSGKWTFYSVEDSRVRGHLARVFEELQEHDEDEE